MSDDGLRGKQLIVDAEEYMALWREAHGEGPMFVPGGWLVDRLGFTLEWWAERARSGDVEATQDSEGSPWHYVRESAIAYVLRLKEKRTASKVKRRGPWVEQEQRKAG